MAKKVNIDAVTAAIIAQERYFTQVSCRQHNTILYIEPRVYNLDVKEIIGISLRLTGQLDYVFTSTSKNNLRLFVNVNFLLPEFIVEGEEIAEDDNTLRK